MENKSATLTHCKPNSRRTQKMNIAHVIYMYIYVFCVVGVFLTQYRVLLTETKQMQNSFYLMTYPVVLFC